MLIFGPPLVGCNSDGHTTIRSNGNILMDFKFDGAIHEVVSILLVKQFDYSINLVKLSYVRAISE